MQKSSLFRQQIVDYAMMMRMMAPWADDTEQHSLKDEMNTGSRSVGMTD